MNGSPSSQQPFSMISNELKSRNASSLSPILQRNVLFHSGMAASPIGKGATSRKSPLHKTFKKSLPFSSPLHTTPSKCMSRLSSGVSPLSNRNSPQQQRSSSRTSASKLSLTPIKKGGISKIASPLLKKSADIKCHHSRKDHALGPADVSPGVAKISKTVTYDRFIPSRHAIDMASAQFNLKEHKFTPQNLDAETLAYQQEMAKACGLALNQRILAFKAEPPVARKEDLRTTWNRPLRAPNSKIAKRQIPTAPEKVLDAPGMLDDYYLNLLHWSSRNMLAVRLENTVYLWDAESGSVQEFFTTNDNDSLTSIEWTLDGSYLAVGLNSGDTQIWDVDSASKIRSMKGHAARVGVLSWDKHIVSSGCRDGSIWNHDVRIAKHKVAEMINHSAEVCGLEWRPDGKFLASGGNDNMVNIWDARSNQPCMTKGNHRAAVKAVAWCPWQLNLLATGGGSNDKNIHFWNATTNGKIATIATDSQVTSLRWSRDYKEISSTHGFPNNHISIWSYPSLNKVADLEGHDMRILHSSLSPDGQTLATCAADESLKFWKTFEKRPKSKTKKADDDELSIATSRLTIR